MASELTGQPATCGNTSVSGPGQKRSASCRDSGSNATSFSAAATPVTWAMSGLKLGRPLVS